MTDKIFEDNDLLDEKSYDTRIAEAANVQPDATYLDEAGYKKRLTEAIETGSGGGGDNYDIREITIVNNRERSEDICTVAVIQKQRDIKRSYNTSVFGGSSKTVEVIAPQYSSSANNYKAQLLIIQTKSSFTEPVINPAVATIFGHTVVDRYRYTIIETVPGSKDITLTIS